MTFDLLIVTPYKKYLEIKAESLSLFTAAGQINVLPGHIDLIANVEICIIEIVANGAIKKYATGGGSISVDRISNKVTLILSSIESVEEIDIDRAMESKRIAEELVVSATSKREIEKAEIKLKKAINRLSLKQDEGM